MDREAVFDGNLVTSRNPDDIHAFNREMIGLFAGGAETRQGRGTA
jgi:protease I